jgi:hypothetical protein
MKAFTTVTALLASAGSAMGALQQVTGFGSNPTNIQMFISVPAKIATNPAIIVAVSACIVKFHSKFSLTVSSSCTHVAAQHLNGTAAPNCQPHPRALATS